MILIGIDPAFRVNGFGICSIDTQEKTVRFIRVKRFLEFISFAQNEMPIDRVKVTVENSNLQNITFDMRGNKNEIARKSRNVGANQAISQTVYDLCCDILGKKNVKEISPAQKGAKQPLSMLQAVCRRYNWSCDYTKIKQDDIDAFFIALKGMY